MDAKDRLRLYLEQRRELGESELVLDALPVEDVLRMIGAPATASGASKSQAKPTAHAVRPQELQSPPVQPMAGHESQTEVVAEQSRANGESPAVVSSAPVAPPANPAARFDESAPVDWRTALQNAEAKDAGNNRNGSSPESAVSAPSTQKANAPSVNANSSGAAQPASSSSVAANTELPAWLSALAIPRGLNVSPLFESTTNAAALKVDSLTGLAGMIGTCRACSLGASAINPVPGEGNSNADFVCVGEAPGQTEDESGRPFVGPAGQLLTKILGAIQLRREDVFICNVLKHRPPGNRNPHPDEVRACTPYLTRQLELLKPKVILALGTFAAQTLLNTTTAMGKLRGQVHRYQDIPLIVTYHPSALLRNETWKRPAWDDVRLARRILDAARAASPAAH